MASSAVRLLLVTTLFSMMLAAPTQASPLGEGASSLSTIESLLPERLREWLYELSHSAPPRPPAAAQVNKCGGGIDPNGKPCPSPPQCSDCG
jgi:hypothetical protein